MGIDPKHFPKGDIGGNRGDGIWNVVRVRVSRVTEKNWEFGLGLRLRVRVRVRVRVGVKVGVRIRVRVRVGVRVRVSRVWVRGRVRVS